ncbi:U3-containing 90S pre-ribosomal complex subunit-domain containing protein, partial [Mrakia frigida]|uniref:U3-containing 90S pre-ribosomal complex subunit-domain containing protein n=1 Tax=Mrakia frigida TaxID=29902 RepID=UPI003FCC0FFC
MADSLEDDYFQTAEEFLSDVEGSDGGGEVQWDEDLDGDADISAPKAVAGSKRKASAADDLSEREDESDDEEVGGAAGMTVGAGGGGGRELTAEEKKKEKKKRNKEKLKEKKKLRLTNPTAAVVPSKFAKPTATTISPALLSSPTDLLQYFRTNQRLALKHLSSLEWEDRELPSNSLLPTSPSPYSLSDVLFSLPTRLPSTAPKENGSPHVIILASSGQRCADLVRELRALIPGSTSIGGAEEKKGKKGGKKAGAAGRGEIAKLFAKHFKLSEHITYLSTTSILMAVGTPHRIAELLKDSKQSLKAPPYVLLDLTHRDSKTRSLLEIVECRDSIWRDVFSLEAGLGGLVGREEGGVLLGA